MANRFVWSGASGANDGSSWEDADLKQGVLEWIGDENDLVAALESLRIKIESLRGSAVAGWY